MKSVKITTVRKTIQLSFLLFTLYIWWRFYLFVRHFDHGTPFVPRPQSIDAFLPIGSLIALKNLIVNGYVDPVHPAGLVIFTAILITALIVRRGICSWVCPVGTLSEYFWRAGRKITGRNFKIGGMADLLLRSIKYLLLFFFLKVILIDMDRFAVSAFLMSPYWAVADAKLLDFWLKPGTLTIIVTSLIALASLFIKNFWCRYLCPYGALLGIISLISPTRVVRLSDRCNECRACDRACPSNIEVSKKRRINSEECIACFECVASCPRDALEIRLIKKINPLLYPAILLGILFLAVIIAKVTGNWDSALSYEDYARLIPVRYMYSH